MSKLLWGVPLLIAFSANVASGQTGACCGYVDGLCTDGVTEAGCTDAIFGQYMGDGSSCDHVTCPPIGACCDPDSGNCVTDTTQILCEFYWHRTWLGETVTCYGAENPCPQPPRGACCLPNGLCEPETTVDDCLYSYGGAYQGDATACEAVECPQPLVGACCFYTHGCLVLQDWQCAENDGVFQGADTVCWPDPCESGEPPSLGWSDTFESYEAGTLLYHVGGWSGWDDQMAYAGTVSAVQAHSAPNSIAVNDTSDAVHPLSNIEGGQWVITAWQYIPSDLSGMTYFVVNSYYEHGGPYYWTVELHFDPATGMVNDALRDTSGASALPIAYDQWAEIRIEVDLDTSGGTITEYYNNQLLFTGMWVVGIGQMAIANIDLFAPHQTVVYYDDISVLPAEGPAPPHPVRPLFVGVRYGELPTRTCDLSGFPAVTWNNGFGFGVEGAAGLPDGSLYLSNGGELWLSALQGPPVYLTDLAQDVQGLAYGRGRLFGFCNSASPMGIYEIDPLTGDTSLAVATGSRRFFGLDYNAADGLLYGYDEYGSPSGLCSIDIDSGVITRVASSVPSANSAARGLACGYNKVYAVTVYGAEYPMYVYDLAQGSGGTWQPMTHPFPDSNSTSGAAWIPGPVTGDVNCDGLINVFDIDPFVLALVDSGAYSAAFPDCMTWNADANLDGVVNVFDIDPFVLILTGK